MVRWAILVLAFLLLGGCTADMVARGFPIDQPKDVETVRAGTLVSDDPHEGSRTVRGPIVSANNAFLGPKYTIRGWINPANPAVDNHFQIVVVATFEHRVYLKQAYAYGEKLETKLIDHERKCNGGCETTETIGIALSEAEMEGYASTGLEFEIVGRRADVVIRIPAAYFAGVLAVHRASRAA